jgi:hypothetical protein
MVTRPGVLLRLEAGIVLAAAIVFFARVEHGSWWACAVFFLALDLSLPGYAAKQRPPMAAALYSAAHTYLLPMLLACSSWWINACAGEVAAAIWIAHIASDRLLGVGLKYPEAFKPTHLQAVARFRA